MQFLPKRAISHPRWNIRCAVAAACSIGFAGLLPQTILSGDPPIYRERVMAILENGLPYLSVPIEHFPGSLVPMFLAWYLGGFIGPGPYILAFAGLMAVCVWLIGLLLISIGDEQELFTRRFLIGALPILPLVLFRNDPWVVFAAVAAIAALRQLKPSSGFWLGLAIVSKGWPISLAPGAWAFGRKREGVLAGLAATGILGLVLLSPGYVGSQPAGTIHAETLIGSFVGLLRAAGREAVGVLPALRAGILVPDEFVLLNLAPGLMIAALALVNLRRSRDWVSFMVVSGGLTIGITLALPALSAQYLFWFAPFVVFATKAVRGGYLIANALTLGLVLTWFAVLSGSLLWWSVLLVRNLLLVWIGLKMASHRDTPFPVIYEYVAQGAK